MRKFLGTCFCGLSLKGMVRAGVVSILLFDFCQLRAQAVYSTYEIDGPNLKAVRQKIFGDSAYAGIGPRDISGQSRAGTCHISVGFKADYMSRFEGGSCCSYASNTRGEIKIFITRPVWIGQGTALDEDSVAWDQFMAGLGEHSQGHANIYQAAKDSMELKISEILNDAQICIRGSCPVADTLIRNGFLQILKNNAEWKKAVSKVESRQKAYDDSTDYGGRQGAVLP
ncbi:MAG: DUF922 domain-containing Zn-dependent protease [candidate division Zixibacteria bacterium]|nr:DUF922 domain-containing Zn-dependent protease [candidate division Zixibacteria bacterium]